MVINANRRRDLAKADRYRCILNGRDVSDRTFYADTRRGVVRMFKVNAEGHTYVDPATMDSAAWEERRGTVRLRRK